MTTRELLIASLASLPSTQVCRWVTTFWPSLPTVSVLAVPVYDVESERYPVVKAIASVVETVLCITRATATFRPLWLTAVVRTGVTRSMAPTLTLSSESTSATVALVVVSLSVLPSTETVTTLGVVTDIARPRRPSG